MNDIGTVNSENTSTGASIADGSSQSDLSLKELGTALDQRATTPIQSTDKDPHQPSMTQDEIREYYRQFRIATPGFSVKYSTGDGTKLGDILDSIVYEASEDECHWRSTQEFDQDIYDAGGTIEVDGQKYEKRTLTNSELDVSRLAYLTRTDKKMIEGTSPESWSTLSGYPINTFDEHHEFLRKKDASANTELWVNMNGWELEPAASHVKEAGHANIADGPGPSA
ncbi:hypothetical protein I203_105776 [Kwoniella mangroviensis CBS 8507]|uniref:uncharacterized protein n=1 Tax=Kwoniella mangroviensis CBS 8507 TaxID=1296122 RepID=UPI00080D6A35|nr:uncharacterized protein I203_01588 [Kwoniella mangroviensis CBS 8507]OCF69724.1 hypothetical protein I203_01588 [Kwoniella mangroviensis CBS 8507]